MNNFLMNKAKKKSTLNFQMNSLTLDLFKLKAQLTTLHLL